MRCAFAHSDIVFATEQGTSVAGPLWYWILEEAGQDADGGRGGEGDAVGDQACKLQHDCPSAPPTPT